VRDLAFVVAWVVLLPLAVRGGAQLGVVLWTWTSLLAPNEVLYGIGSELPYAKIAAVLTLGLMLAGRGGGMKLRWDASVLLMIALAVWGLAAQSMGIAADPAAGWDLYEKYLKILLLGVVVTVVMRDRLRLHALLLAICLGIGFSSLGEGAKFLLSGGAHKVQGTLSTGDNNQIGLDVLLIMPILYYLHATARRRPARIIWLSALGMCPVCVIATASRAAFVGLALLGVVYVLRTRRKVVGLLTVALVAFAGSQLVSDAWVNRMNTIQSAEDDDSFLGRVGAWKISTVVALHHPLTGGGFHAIQNGDVWTPTLGEASQMDWFGTPPPPLAVHAAHSIYFEVLGDLGFVGLALFLALFRVAWRNAVKVRAMVRRSQRPDLVWAGQLAGALQVSVLVFLVVGASLSAAYYDLDYLLVAMLAVLRDLVERALREPPPVRTDAPEPAPPRRAAAPLPVG
jgi:probable O-glycosylation ligase (exosortase A-associated)